MKSHAAASVLWLLIPELTASGVINIDEHRPPDFNITLSSDYDNAMPPKNEDIPAKAHVSICPWKIGEISFTKMTIEVDVYVSIQWDDMRLKITPQIGNGSIVTLKPEEYEPLWIPVVNFRNGMADETLNSAHNPGLLGLQWNGEYFTVMIRKTDMFHCDFKLYNYPLDTQKCLIEVQATNYKSSLSLTYEPCAAEGLLSGSEPPEFRIYDLQYGSCTREDKLSTFFSCVEFQFSMDRQSTNLLMFTYLPSILIVILTFVSFWLEAHNAAPRVAISLTSLLTLTTQFATVQKELPPVSYIKAIDVWMFACIFMVFGGLVEFAIANFVDRVRPKRKTVPEINSNQSTTTTFGRHPFPIPIVSPPDVKHKVDNSIDRAARIAFPVAFLIFNIVYWSVYGSLAH